MYKPGKKLSRKEWDAKQKSSFAELEKIEEDLLTFHLNPKNEYIKIIQKFLCYNQFEITATQLRNVFNLILSVKDKPENLNLQRIKLAYIAGRTDPKKCKGMLNLLDLLDNLFEKVNGEKEKYIGVKTFVEAVVAYHKYYATLYVKPIR